MFIIINSQIESSSGKMLIYPLGILSAPYLMCNQHSVFVMSIKWTELNDEIMYNNGETVPFE